MYRITLPMHNRLARGEQPTIYCVIQTHLGYRAYGAKALQGVFTAGTTHLLDGSWTLDGSTLLGSESAGIIEMSPRVLDFGSVERTISPRTSDLLAAYQGKQQQNISMQLDNADAYFSRLIAKEPFLGRPLQVFVGFEEEPQYSHLKLFSGIIVELSMLAIMSIQADEQ